MKKLKGTLPAWLWFSLYNGMVPHQKWTEEKEKLGLEIKKKLSEHLILFDLANSDITEPNNFDNCQTYGFDPEKARDHFLEVRHLPHPQELRPQV